MHSDAFFRLRFFVRFLVRCFIFYPFFLLATGEFPRTIPVRPRAFSVRSLCVPSFFLCPESNPKFNPNPTHAFPLKHPLCVPLSRPFVFAGVPS